MKIAKIYHKSFKYRAKYALYAATYSGSVCSLLIPHFLHIFFFFFLFLFLDWDRWESMLFSHEAACPALTVSKFLVFVAWGEGVGVNNGTRVF